MDAGTRHNPGIRRSDVLVALAVAVMAWRWHLSADDARVRFATDTRTDPMLLGCAAAVAVIGITWAYDAKTGDLVIHGLTFSSILLLAWEWAKQFVLQQVLYDGIVQNRGQK